MELFVMITALTFYMIVILLLAHLPVKRAVKEVHQKMNYAVKSTEYSNELLKTIRSFVAEIAVIRFRTFIDGRAADKITREQVKNLVDSVAKDAEKYLEIDHINYEILLYTDEFIQDYIVQVAVNSIKDLLSKYILAATEEE